MKTRTETIAPLALRHVQAAAAEPASAHEFKQLCRGAGAHIRHTGLGGFLAFLLVKKDPAEAALLEAILDSWNDLKVLSDGPHETASDMLESLRHLGQPEYMHAVRITLQIMLWHKRMAETLIEDPDEAEKAGVLAGGIP